MAKIVNVYNDWILPDKRAHYLAENANSIKAVTFDLWETLLFEKDGSSDRRNAKRCKNLAETLHKFGLKVSTNDMDLATEKMISTLLPLWEINKDVTTLEQLQLIVKSPSKGKIQLKNEWVEELTSAYVSAVYEIRPYINPDAKTVLKWLQNRGIKIGLICNTGITPGTALRQLLSEEDVAQYFDVMIFSNEVGIRKPDPEIFHLTTQKLQVKPFQTVHVGDNLKADVWGAKNAGFKTVYFDSEEGKDRTAESDPTSLVAQSRKLDNLKKHQVTPDKRITSFKMIAKTIEELEKSY
jgi:putative hydrolase of the HAD superfamily